MIDRSPRSRGHSPRCRLPQNISPPLQRLPTIPPRHSPALMPARASVWRHAALALPHQSLVVIIWRGRGGSSTLTPIPASSAPFRRHYLVVLALLEKERVCLVVHTSELHEKTAEGEHPCVVVKERFVQRGVGWAVFSIRFMLHHLGILAYRALLCHAGHAAKYFWRWGSHVSSQE
jgi:hypothetical protein